MIAPTSVNGLFVGQVALLAGDSRSSAIVKTPVAGRCRLTMEGLAGDTQADRRAHIAEHGLAGWYYRVLEAGECAVGDLLEHLERPPEAVTLAEFWRVIRAPKPSVASLLRLAYAAGLDSAWTAKLTQRAEWLRNNPSGPTS